MNAKLNHPKKNSKKNVQFILLLSQSSSDIFFAELVVWLVKKCGCATDERFTMFQNVDFVWIERRRVMKPIMHVFYSIEHSHVTPVKFWFEIRQKRNQLHFKDEQYSACDNTYLPSMVLHKVDVRAAETNIFSN